MAGVTLSDVIVPELFTPYVIKKTMEKSALFQSGIVANSSEFDKLASQASPVVSMPFFEDLTGESEAVVEGTDLTADGIVGPATLRALGMTTGGGSGSSSQSASLDLLARVISAEARGEPYSGQVAVGAVILNRVEHPSFPNTIAGVVYQPGAFTCMVDGQFNEPVAQSAVQAAQEALGGADPSGGAIYYFNPATATSSWIWSRPLILQIGNHRFCA